MSNNKQQHQHLLKLKGFVNNTTQWKAFNELLDFLTEMEHKTMEQAVDTIELEKYRNDAANWKAVALEQLRVMAEILGLF